MKYFFLIFVAVASACDSGRTNNRSANSQGQSVEAEVVYLSQMPKVVFKGQSEGKGLLGLWEFVRILRGYSK